MFYLAYVGIGLLAGILAGLLGLGGGVIIVPGLLAMFTWQHFPIEHIMHVATATSLAAIMLTSIITTWFHEQAWLSAVAIIALFNSRDGARCVAWCLRWQIFIYSHIKKRFCGVLYFAGFKNAAASESCQSCKRKACSLETVFVFYRHWGLCRCFRIRRWVIDGAFAYLVWIKYATSQCHFCNLYFPTALAGMLTAMVVGWHTSGLPPQSLGFVYWPGALILGVGSAFGAPLGVYLVNRLPTARVKQIFAVILMIIAWRMLPI